MCLQKFVFTNAIQYTLILNSTTAWGTLIYHSNYKLIKEYIADGSFLFVKFKSKFFHPVQNRAAARRGSENKERRERIVRVKD